MAIPALARFASDAFNRVLELAANEEDAGRVANALATLHKIVFFDVLPPEDLSRVIQVAQARLASTEVPMVWQAAVELAVATRDPQLRSTVGGIASGAIQPAFSEREDLRLWVRSAAQRALGSGHAGRLM
jgi:hypothetical protein